MEEKQIDHRYTSEVTCPYCGTAERDSWEISHDSGNMNCGECEKEFFYERYIEVTYVTSKLKEEEKITKEIVE